MSNLARQGAIGFSLGSLLAAAAVWLSTFAIGAFILEYPLLVLMTQIVVFVIGFFLAGTIASRFLTTSKKGRVAFEAGVLVSVLLAVTLSPAVARFYPSLYIAAFAICLATGGGIGGAAIHRALDGVIGFAIGGAIGGTLIMLLPHAHGVPSFDSTLIGIVVGLAIGGTLLGRTLGKTTQNATPLA